MSKKYEFHPIANIFPMIENEELQKLNDDIKKNGLLEPILLYEDKILDGRNRYEVCEKLGIEPETKTFTGTRLDAIDHVWSYNRIRRHLTPSQIAMACSIRDKMINEFGVVREEAKERKAQAPGMPQGTKKSHRELFPKEIQPSFFTEPLATPKEQPTPIEVHTRDIRAKAAGVNARYIDQADNILATNPKLADEILRGEKTIPQAQRELKKEEIKAKLESISEQKTKEISGVYDVIVIDPPWPMEKIERDVRPNQVDFDYPTMTEEQLKEFKIPAFSDCHLWCWTTQKFLPMAFRLLEYWNFKYVCTFVWHKSGGIQPIGLPQYNCEFVLYARKGTPKFIDTKNFFTCFNANRQGHSVKPEEFYDTIRRVTAGRRIDIFSRRKINGFDSWGNEIE